MIDVWVESFCEFAVGLENEYGYHREALPACMGVTEIQIIASISGKILAQEK